MQSDSWGAWRHEAESQCSSAEVRYLGAKEAKSSMLGTLHSFILHWCDMLKARRRHVPVLAGPFLSRSPWRMATCTKQTKEHLSGAISVVTWFQKWQQRPEQWLVNTRLQKHVNPYICRIQFLKFDDFLYFLFLLHLIFSFCFHFAVEFTDSLHL